MVTIIRPSSGKGSLSYARRFQRGKYAPDNSVKAPASQFRNAQGAQQVNVIEVDPNKGYNPALRSSALRRDTRQSLPGQTTTQKLATAQQSFKTPASQFRDSRGAVLTSKTNKAGITEYYGSYKQQVTRDRAFRAQARIDAFDYYQRQDRKAYLSDVKQKQFASAVVRGRARVPVTDVGYSVYQDMLSGPVVSQPALYRVEERARSPVRTLSPVSFGMTSQPSPYAIRRVEIAKKGTWAEKLPSTAGIRRTAENKLSTVYSKSVEFEKKGYPKSFFLTGSKGPLGFRASEITSFGVGLGTGAYEGLRQQPRKAALYFALGGALPSIAAGLKYAGYRAGLGKAVPVAGKALGAGFTAYYLYGKGKEFRSQRKGDSIKDTAILGDIFGRSITTEILPSYAGARTIGVRLARPLTGRVMIEEAIVKYKLPSTEAKAFRSVLTTTFKGQPPVKPLNFKGVQALRGRGPASEITKQFLLKNKGFFKQNLVVGGSVAQQSQLYGVKSRSPRDVDVFLRAPGTAARGLAKSLRSGGVRGVSYSVGGFGQMRTGKVFLSGRKAVEFHKLAWFNEFPYRQSTARSPDGIRVLRLGEQASRKAFGGFIAERSKDIPDYELLAKAMFRDQLAKAGKSFIAPKYKEKVIRSDMAKFYKNLGIVKTFMGKKGSASLSFSRQVTQPKVPKVKTLKSVGYSEYKPFRGVAYQAYSKGRYMPYGSFAYAPVGRAKAYKPFEEYKPYRASRYRAQTYIFRPYSYRTIGKSYVPYPEYRPYTKPSYSYKESSYSPTYRSTYNANYNTYYNYPKQPPPPFITNLPSLAFPERGLSKNYLQPQKKKYTPSLIALDLKLKGKAPKKITGFEIRPLSGKRNKFKFL